VQCRQRDMTEQLLWCRPSRIVGRGGGMLCVLGATISMEGTTIRTRAGIRRAGQTRSSRGGTTGQLVHHLQLQWTFTIACSERHVIYEVSRVNYTMHLIASYCFGPPDVTDRADHGRTYTPLVSCRIFTSRLSASLRPSQTVTFGSTPQPVTPTATACISSVAASPGATSNWPARSPVQTNASAVARSTLTRAECVGWELTISRGKQNG
jgi:hypothetical protein